MNNHTTSITTNRKHHYRELLAIGIPIIIGQLGTLGQHDHATAMALEQIHVGVHTTGCRRSHRTASHACRSLGRTGIVDGVILDVLRQLFTLVQTLFQLGMSDVATYNDGTIQLETGSHRILVQYLQDLRHRLVQVDTNGIALAGLTQLFRNQFTGVAVQLLNPDTLLVDLTLDVTVG